MTVPSGRTWYKDNVTVYAGSSANPETALTLTSSDETGSVYELATAAEYIKISNASNYAVYMEKVELTLE